MTDDLIPRRVRCTSDRGKRLEKRFGVGGKGLTMGFLGISEGGLERGKLCGDWKSRRKAKLVGGTCGIGM